ncbi:MAG: PQQ-binding-like beta-propeller repeat protein [Candidatus Bathyarchaeota archaeon]|nr:PQQ-binding-like beta-propeller repeat protein [Candidatus Bathyarchaeum sp.]
METKENKKIATTVALILLLTITATLITLPIVSAHDPTWTIVSYAYIVPAPNPVGVDQNVIIVMWVDTPLPSASVNNNIRRHDYYLTIMKPDGTNETMHWPVVSDTTSIQYVSYTPTQVGTYTLLFEYPEQVYEWSGTYANDVFTAASKTATLIVQEDPLPLAVSSYPLPTEYWTRPIEGQNTDWWAISSNWLGKNSPQIRTGETATGGAGYGQFQPEGPAPETSHVMWSQSIQDGGVVGGSGFHVEGTTYYMGGSYNVRFGNPIIMYGRLYYELPYGNSGGGGGWMCVDLRTGEEVWYNEELGVSLPEPSFGYLYDYDMYNQHGIIPEGWLISESGGRGSPVVWNFIDPSTGKVADLVVENVPDGTDVAGPNGEILTIVVDSENKWVAQWNCSRAIDVRTSGTIDASAASYYDWNVSISDLGPGSWTLWREVSFDDIMLLTQGGFGTHVGVYGASISSLGANVTAVSLAPESRGEVLWMEHYDVAPNNVSREITAWDPEIGIFIFEDKETMVRYGYSLEDGSMVWGPTEPSHDYDTLRTSTIAAYGNLYCAGFGAILYCYDIATGELEWTYGNGGVGNSTNAGLGTAYGTYPIFVDVVADGKVYLATTEHSPGSPFYKGSQFRCVDAYTGEEIWTMLGWGTGMYASFDAVADGFFAFLNCYDMKVYSVGKGPSSTTVTASPKIIDDGDNVLIEGTVLDIATGTTQDEQIARFPSGVPAVSDESMSGWMEYVYMQKPMPDDVKGVTVTLTAIDPNGNYQDIGKVTTDINGNFATVWQPPVPGEYQITATFEGSEAYWPSDATTYIGVSEATSTATPIEPEEPVTEEPVTEEPVTEEPVTEPEETATETALISTETLIIAAIVIAAIIGAVSIFVLRKRK